MKKYSLKFFYRDFIFYACELRCKLLVLSFVLEVDNSVFDRNCSKSDVSNSIFLKLFAKIGLGGEPVQNDSKSLFMTIL